LSFKFLPGVNQSMAGKDGLKACGIQRARLDEFKQSGLVLGAPSLERDGGKVFGGEDPGPRSIHVFLPPSCRLAP
jgi:hypothetical protein